MTPEAIYSPHWLAILCRSDVRVVLLHTFLECGSTLSLALHPLNRIGYLVWMRKAIGNL